MKSTAELLAQRFTRDMRICHNNLNDMIGNLDDMEEKILSYEMALRYGTQIHEMALRYGTQLHEMALRYGTKLHEQ